MKTLSAIIAGVMMIFISCNKEVNEVHQGEVSSDIRALDTKDSVIFSRNVGPHQHRKYDTQYHKLLVDSFRNNTDIIIQRVTLTVNDFGGITRKVRMFIDGSLVDFLRRQTRYEFYTRYFDFTQSHDTIKAGNHRLLFWGTSYPLMDSVNVYYSIYQGDFECTDLKGNLVSVYGLPIIIKKRHFESDDTN